MESRVGGAGAGAGAGPAGGDMAEAKAGSLALDQPGHVVPTPSLILRMRNNERLLVVARALSEPDSFMAGIVELAEWCSGFGEWQKEPNGTTQQRWGQHFEYGLLGCLEVLTRLAPRLSLGHIDAGLAVLEHCLRFANDMTPLMADKVGHST